MTTAFAPALAPPRPMLAGPLPDDCLLSTGHPFWPAIEKRFGNARYVLEPKIDGHRKIIVIRDGDVTAWSRPLRGKPALRQPLPVHLVHQLAKLPDVTLDSELYFPGGQSSDVTRIANQPFLEIVVFDILAIGTLDTLSQPWSGRRALLAELFSRGLTSASVRLTPVFPVSQAAVDAIWDGGGEGAILKPVEAAYRPDSRKTWLKIKGLATAVVTITGFETGKSGRYSKICILTAQGRATTVKTRGHALYRRIEADPAAFIDRKARIEYTELTPDGAFRHARFDRMEAE